MVTFKPTIFKDRQRDDKTWNAFIRFYARKKSEIHFHNHVCHKERFDGKHENQEPQILDRCDVLIR